MVSPVVERQFCLDPVFRLTYALCLPRVSTLVLPTSRKVMPGHGSSSSLDVSPPILDLTLEFLKVLHVRLSQIPATVENQQQYSQSTEGSGGMSKSRTYRARKSQSRAR